MDFEIYTLKERPELLKNCLELFEKCWSPFMIKAKTKENYGGGRLLAEFSKYNFAMMLNNKLIAMGESIPFFWDATLEGLPEGWDDVVKKGSENTTPPNTLSALSITIHPDFRGKGLAGVILKKMRESVLNNDLKHLIVPLRPTFKSLYPLTKFEEYVKWCRDDGEHFDPWIRTHMRLGAKILKPATKSMDIKATIQDWENWTGMKFHESGDYIVKNALAPIQIDKDANIGRYVEPNLWMQHM